MVNELLLAALMTLAAGVEPQNPTDKWLISRAAAIDTNQGICFDETQDNGNGSNQQGPMLTGKGLTGCYLSTRLPFPAGKKELAVTMNCGLCPHMVAPNIVLKNCTPIPNAGKETQLCDATADVELCHGIGAGHLLHLLVTKDRYEKNGKLATTPPSDPGVDPKAPTYTLSCGKKNGSDIYASAIYKCSHGLFEKDCGPDNDKYWKFVPGTPEFNVCVRAARADYCGTGLHFTQFGTRIELVSLKHKKHKKGESDCEEGMCDEATWNEDGATCVFHPRWQTNGDLANPVNSITSPYLSDCKWDPPSSADASSASCSSFHSPTNVAPALFLTRSKLHYNVGDDECDPDVKNSHSEHKGKDCALDCPKSAPSSICPPIQP